MYVDGKLTTNIKSSIASRIRRIPGLSASQQAAIGRAIVDGLTEGLEVTDEERLLKEKAGHPMWDTLHYTAKVADKEGKPDIYLKLLDVYKNGHPCVDECRPHLVRNLQMLDPRSYESMFDHSIDLHNLVNNQLGKAVYSYEDADKKYDLDCDSCIFAPSGKSSSSAPSVALPSTSNGINTGRARNSNQARVLPHRRSTPSSL